MSGWRRAVDRRLQVANDGGEGNQNIIYLS